MKASVIVKIVAVIVVLGIIIWAVKFREQKQMQVQDEFVASKQTKATVVNPGAITVDGKATDWTEIRPFSLRWSGSTENEWRAVCIAHDRANLYLLIELPYIIEDRAPKERGALNLGSIYVDADNNPATGEPSSVSNIAPGCERIVWLQAKPASGAQPCIGYWMEEYDQNTPEGGVRYTKIEGSEVYGDTAPQTVAGYRYNLEVAIPLASLGIVPPCKSRLLFMSGGGDMPELIVDMP
jgi:hypothetical protein